MERRDAHVHQTGQLFDIHRLIESRPQQGHCFDHPLQTRIRLAHLRDASPYRRPQHANQNLVEDQRCDQVSVCRVSHQLQQSNHRVDNRIVGVADVQRAAFGNLRESMRIDLRGESGDLLQVEQDLEVR